MGQLDNRTMDKLWDHGTTGHTMGQPGLWDKLWDHSYNRIHSGPTANRTNYGFMGQQDNGTTELQDKLWDHSYNGIQSSPAAKKKHHYALLTIVNVYIVLHYTCKNKK